ncbi:MAG: hypothetical protein WDK95_05375 [Syntrophorhabdaceae bacterium]
MTITETEIAMIFFKRNFKRVDEAWPHIYNKLKGMLGKSYPFEIEDEEEAKTMLTFAVISIEIQNLKKFFPDQSERILNKFIKIINSLEEGDYINEKIAIYTDKVKESYKQHEENERYSIFEEVSVQLMQDWFGDNVSKFYVRNTEVVNPLIIGLITLFLISLTDFWEKNKDNLVIIKD